MKVSLRQVALGFALCEADNKVREVGGANTGPRVRKYLAGTDPPIMIAAPWCAAFVQYVTDRAAWMIGVPNPLDDVKLEAYVQSYYVWAKANGALVKAEVTLPGDLVLFNFNSERWNHMGIVVSPPDANPGSFKTVEGNTNEAGSREGDGVYMKIRSTKRGYPTTFVRYAE